MFPIMMRKMKVAAMTPVEITVSDMAGHSLVSMAAVSKSGSRSQGYHLSVHLRPQLHSFILCLCLSVILLQRETMTIATLIKASI